MDPIIFVKIVGETDITKAFLNMSENEDELCTVLRVHLLSERLLDAWVAAKIGVADLFINTQGENLRFNPSFAMKLALAKKLGLHAGACTFLSRINKLRNGFAHQYECSPLKNNDINAMAEAISLIPKEKDIIEIWDINLSIQHAPGIPTLYPFSSELTPNRIKLISLYAGLFARLTLGMRQHLK